MPPRWCTEIGTPVAATAPAPPPPTDCPDELDGSALAGASERIPAEEADGLRFLPTQLPDGREILRVWAWRDQAGCPDDLVLALQADGGGTRRSRPRCT